jgi:hypothetical protein
LLGFSTARLKSPPVIRPPRTNGNRETLHAIGDALIQTGAALQPHGCNGQVQSNGYFNTQCY